MKHDTRYLKTPTDRAITLLKLYKLQQDEEYLLNAKTEIEQALWEHHRKMEHVRNEMKRLLGKEVR